jgi:hypothetical protein
MGASRPIFVITSDKYFIDWMKWMGFSYCSQIALLYIKNGLD